MMDAMTLRLQSLVINTGDLGRAYAFWAQALGARTRDGQEPEEGLDWLDLVLPGGARVALQTGTVTAVDHDQPIHLDLAADDRPGEVKRLVALGATEVPSWPYPADADYTILRDPDGHLFCVVDPG